MVSRLTDLVLVETLPLQRVAVGLQVLSKRGAAVGDWEVGQQLLEGDGVSVLVQERTHNGHQLGEGLLVSTVGAVHYTLRPQGGAQLAQQEAHFLPAQTQHGLEQAVQLHTGHHANLRNIRKFWNITQRWSSSLCRIYSILMSSCIFPQLVLFPIDTRLMYEGAVEFIHWAFWKAAPVGELYKFGGTKEHRWKVLHGQLI